MRHAFAALAFALSACAASPPAAPTAPTATAAVLAAAPSDGQWLFSDAGDFVATAFTYGRVDSDVFLQCDRASRRVTLYWKRQTADPEPQMLRVVTAAASIDLAARDYNNGMPHVAAEADAAAFALLAEPQDRFAIAFRRRVEVLPWHDSIAQTIAACR